MRALNSRFVLIDITNNATSWNHHRPKHSHCITRTRGAHQRPPQQQHSSVLRTPHIRKPSDHRTTFSNGSSSLDHPPNPASTSRVEACTELELFLEMLPLRMRGELCGHQEIGELIEVVLDLGRKPLARFPSGDWVISEHPVKLEDLTHSISKVILFVLFKNLVDYN